MKFMIRLVLCLSILQTPYVRAEWEGESVLDQSVSTPSSRMAATKKIQEILQNGTAEQIEILEELALNAAESMMQKALPGMELQDIIAHLSDHMAEDILRQLENRQLANKMIQKNETRAQSLDTGASSFYPESPMADRMASHKMFPKMVDQLITQFFLKQELKDNPKYLETETGKQRYQHLRLLFLQKQSSTPGLPAERIPSYPFFQKTNMGSSPEFNDGLPFLRDYMDTLADETAVSLQLAYLARQKGQWTKAEEYTHRAQTFVAAAYLAAGNHRGDYEQTQQQQMKISALFLVGSYLPMIFGTMSKSTPQNISMIIGGTSIISLFLLLKSYIQRSRFDRLSERMSLPQDGKFIQSFPKKRLRSWLPRFLQNRIHHQLSQKAISYYWYHLREYMTYSHIPGDQSRYDSAYEDIFQTQSRSRIYGFSESDYTPEAQNAAVDWFYQASTKLTAQAPLQIKTFQCSDIFSL
jgi:hypothetical protein